MNLPSGRELQLKELTYGDIRDAENAQADSGKPGLFIYFDRLMAAMGGLSLDEVRALSVADGRALFEAVRVAQGGRPAQAEGPFEANSSSPSETTQA